MADQVERIRLEGDNTGLKRAVEDANRSIESLEKKVRSRYQTEQREAQSTLRIVENSQRSIDAIVNRAERRAAFAGKTGVDKILAERDLLIKRLKGEQEAIDRVTAAYQKLAEAEKQRPKPGGGGPFGFDFSNAAGALAGSARAILSFKAVSAVLGAPGEIAEATRQLLNYEKSLLAVSSSALQAREKLTQLRQDATAPGLSMDPVITGVVRLQAAGIEFDKARRMVLAFGNALATVGGSQEDLKRVIIALTQISATPFVQGDEIRQLQERLPQIRALMVEAFGTSRTEDIKKLGISSKDFLEGITKGAERLAKVSKTPFDTWAQINDQVRTYFGLLGKVASVKLSGPLEFLLQRFREVTAEAERKMAEEEQRAARRQELTRVDPTGQGVKTRGEIETRLFADAIRARNAKGAAAVQDSVRQAVDDGIRAGQASMQQKKAVADFLGAFGIPSEEQTRTKIEKLKTQLDNARLLLKQGLVTQDAVTIAQQKLNEALYESSPAAKAAADAFKKLNEERAASAKKFRDLMTDTMNEQRNAPFFERRARARNERQQEIERLNEELINVGRLDGQRGAAMVPGGRADLSDILEQQRRQVRESQEAALDQDRALQLAHLDSMNAVTVEQKAVLEARKLEIEKDFIAKSQALQIAKIRAETDEAVAAARQRAALYGIDQAVAEDQIQAIRAAGLERESALEQANLKRIELLRIESAGRVNDAIISEQRRVYDSVRNGFEGVLNAMLAGSRSWGQRLRAILQAVLLTPLTQAASAIFASAITGQSIPGGGMTRRGGFLASIFSGGMSGGGGGFRVPIATGTTGGTYTVPVGAGGGGQRGGGYGNMLGGFAVQGKGAVGMLRSLGNLGHVRNAGTEAASYHGVGGVAGGAMLVGGGALAAYGLYRGGVSGLAMTTAGGALIGYKFGGPVGAAIGAGIGAIAGTVRLFIKGAREKVIQKVRALYQVTIDKSLAGQIVDIAKSAYGGNTDMAIRTQQVRDLIELYAMATAQSPGGMPAKMKPYALSQTSSGVVNVGAQGYYAPAPMPVAAPSSVAPAAASIQLDSEATAKFWENVVANGIVSAPQAVQSASLSAMRSNYGRRDAAAALLRPGLLTT